MTPYFVGSRFYMTLTNNVGGGVKSHFNNRLFLITSSKMENTKNIFPSRLNVMSLGIDHLGNATDDHVSDRWVPINSSTSIGNI